MILLVTAHLLSSCLGAAIRNFALVDFTAMSAANDPLAFLRPILAIAGLLFVALALLSGETILRSLHNRSIAREARELGLAFSADARPFEGSDVHGLPLLRGNPSLEVANVVDATIDGRRALVLELPSGEVCEAETPHQHFTTVAAFRCSEGEVPEFEIGRKSSLSKMGDALWHKAEVVDDREFAKEFFVHCQEPKRVHDWLTPEKLAKLRPAVAPFHVSANSDWILIFRPGAQIAPSQVPAFLRESSRIATALLQ